MSLYHKKLLVLTWFIMKIQINDNYFGFDIMGETWIILAGVSLCLTLRAIVIRSGHRMKLCRCLRLTDACVSTPPSFWTRRYEAKLRLVVVRSDRTYSHITYFSFMVETLLVKCNYIQEVKEKIEKKESAVQFRSESSASYLKNRKAWKCKD